MKEVVTNATITEKTKKDTAIVVKPAVGWVSTIKRIAVLTTRRKNLNQSGRKTLWNNRAWGRFCYTIPSLNPCVHFSCSIMCVNPIWVGE